jgi:predicted phage terminase large subunit-like protein
MFIYPKMVAPVNIEIRPQPKQEVFLASFADIVTFGGAAGGGKTYALLMEPLRNIHNKDFGAVIFRRSISEIVKEGGLWDEAQKLYPLLNGKGNENEHQFNFPKGGRVTFGHLQYDDTVNDWKSAQIPLICFDQLETFTEHQFFYMLSRNRSTCGVRPYIRATANPEPGWLADFLDWWIGEDGYARLDRVGKIRWMIRVNDLIIWADSRDELVDKYPDSLPKSVTFILSTVYDNKILLEKDPGYLANLQALPLVDRERLLGDRERGGNWKVKPSAGKVFNRAWFKVIGPDAIPPGGLVCRRWDFAATEKELNKADPDFTASVLMLRVDSGYYILDVTAEQLPPSRIDAYFENITRQDASRFIQETRRYMCRWEQEPGSAGKRESWRMTVNLAGIDAKGLPAIHDKLTRAKPLATMAENGQNVYVVAAPWNEMFLNHMHGQPELPHDDIMDAAGGAFSDLTRLELRKAGSHQGY